MKQILKRSKNQPSSIKPEKDSLAADALLFLAADHDRLASFLGTTGFDPVTLRQSATDPSFVNGLLDYVMSDDALLVEFASHLKRAPTLVAEAIRRRRTSQMEGF